MARPWFKHYNTASQGDTIGYFLSKQDYECVALFWFLLEYLSRNENNERDGKAVIEMSFLCRGMNMKPSKIRRVLARFSAVSPAFLGGFSDEKFSYLFVNWLDFQVSKPTNVEKKDAKNDRRDKKKELREKEIELKEELELLFSPKKPAPVETSKSKPTPESLRDRQRLKDFWLRLYKITFNQDYVGHNSAAFNSQLKALHLTLGTEGVVQAMRDYVSWNGDQFVVKQGHPLGMIQKTLLAVQAYKQRPRDVMNRVAQARAQERVLTADAESLHLIRGHRNESERKLKLAGLDGRVPQGHLPEFQDEDAGDIPGPTIEIPGPEFPTE